LSGNLGVVSRIQEGVALIPARGLVAELLNGFDQSHDSDDLRDALDWIDGNFFTVYESRTRRPQVHKGFASVLESLEDDDVISLRGMADASNEVEIPGTSGSSVDSRNIKTYSMNEVPDSPAYELPMDRQDMKRRVTA
jgi:hypothetical protein